MIQLIAADILTAFDHSTIGTKVTDEAKFCEAVDAAVLRFDFGSQKVVGQGFILLPEAVPFVSAGVGRRTANPDDYVVREHRGQVAAFLRRDRAAVVEGCAVVVYTLEAYLNDPDVTAQEAARVAGATHILVAVLAFAGPQAPLSPHRFVHNLAGGNNEALVWAADEIREKAKTIMDYNSQWSVVAD